MYLQIRCFCTLCTRKRLDNLDVVRRVPEPLHLGPALDLAGVLVLTDEDVLLVVALRPVPEVVLDRHDVALASMSLTGTARWMLSARTYPNMG